MTTSTLSSSVSSINFVVAMSLNGQNWKKVGFAMVGKRCALDADVAKTFPKGTRGYEDVRKACKWLATESLRGAVSADLTTVRNLKVRVHII